MINRVFRQIAKLCVFFSLLPFVAFGEWSASDSAHLSSILSGVQDVSDYLETYDDHLSGLEGDVGIIRRNQTTYANIIGFAVIGISNLTTKIEQDTDALRDLAESIDDVVETFSDTASIVQNMSYDVGGLTVTTYDIKDINDDIRTTTASILDALSNLEMPEIDLGELTIVMEGMVECCSNVASNTHNIVDVKMELEELVEKIDIFLEKVEDILDSLSDVATETTLSAFREESHDDLIAISNTISQFVTSLYPATTSSGSIDTTSVALYQQEVEALTLNPSMNDTEGVYEQQLDSIDIESDIVNTNQITTGYIDLIDEYVTDDDRTARLGNALADELATIEDKLYEGVNFIDHIPTQDKLYLHSPEFKTDIFQNQMQTIEIDFTLPEETQDFLDTCWESLGYLLKCIAVCYTSYLILNKVLSEWSANPVGL